MIVSYIITNLLQRLYVNFYNVKIFSQGNWTSFISVWK